MRTVALMLVATAIAVMASGCIGNSTVDERSADDPRFCELHHVELVTRRVPKQYGLPGRWRVGLEQASKEFPHANTASGGGCTVDPEQKHALVYSCPLCEKAERAWIEAHEDGPWTTTPPWRDSFK